MNKIQRNQIIRLMLSLSIVLFLMTACQTKPETTVPEKSEQLDSEAEQPSNEEDSSTEQQDEVSGSTYEAWEWLDFYHVEQLPQDSGYELGLPEYLGTVFIWSPSAVTALEPSGEKMLFEGSPIWNVYLADLTGDELPELCATVGFGQEIADTRVIVYDYVNDKLYELSDSMIYDYSLSLDNGRLTVTQNEYSGDTLATGSLAIVNGELTATGIDRTANNK